MGSGVVAGAQQHAVAVGVAAEVPGVGVVQVTQAWWPVAALGVAAFLLQGRDDPLGG